MTLEQFLLSYDFKQGPHTEHSWQAEYVKFRYALRSYWISRGITPEWTAEPKKKG